MDVDDAVSGDQLVTWMSLIRVSQLLPARLDEALRAEGSSLPLYEILAVLSRTPDGVRVTDLCDRALVSKPRVSVHIGELVSAGFVRRQPDPSDGRASIVTITAKGRRKFERWRPGHRSLARELVLDALDPDELRTLGLLLAKIRGTLGDDLKMST